MGFLDLFRPKGADFLGMLLKQADITRQGLAALESYAKTGSKEWGAKVAALEREEDEVRNVLVDELNRTFVTPIDREDIYALSQAIDEVLDYADTTVDQLEMFGLEPTKWVQKMAAQLRESSEEIYDGVAIFRTHPNVALSHAMKAKSLENEVEGLYREAVLELFSSVQSLEQVVYILKIREIYRHLSNAADRAVEAANILGNIAVKTS